MKKKTYDIIGKLAHVKENNFFCFVATAYSYIKIFLVFGCLVYNYYIGSIILDDYVYLYIIDIIICALIYVFNINWFFLKTIIGVIYTDYQDTQYYLTSKGLKKINLYILNRVIFNNNRFKFIDNKYVDKDYMLFIGINSNNDYYKL